MSDNKKELNNAINKIYKLLSNGVNQEESILIANKEKLSQDSNSQQLVTERKRLENLNYKQDINLRKSTSRVIINLIQVWLIFVGLYIFLVTFTDSVKLPSETIESLVKILLVSTTAQVIALLASVLLYLFPKK